MGRHVLQPGQRLPLYSNSAEPAMSAGAVLTSMPFYQSTKELLPPMLTSEGARVDPDWLMKFLKDPSMMQPGEKPMVPSSAPAPASSPPASSSPATNTANANARSEERRVGKECRSRWAP